MLQGSRLTTLLRFNGIVSNARSGRDIFIDELCNFIVNEFEIDAVAIFKIENNLLIPLGKSHRVKKNIQPGVSFNGDGCYELNVSNEFTFTQNDNCTLQITETASYEISITFRIGLKEIILIRVAQKNPFLPAEIEALKTVAQFVKNMTHMWLDARGGIIQSEKNIFGLISTVLGEVRSLINSIAGSISIINDDNIMMGDTSYLSTIKYNSHKLLATVNSFGEIIKIFKGGLELKEEDVELKRTLKETIDILNGKLSGKNVSYHLNYDNAVPKEILIDKQKLQYFFNSFLTIIAEIVRVGNIQLNVYSTQNNLIKIEIKDTAKAAFSNFTSQILQPFGIDKFLENDNPSISGLSFVYLSFLIEKIGGKLSFEENVNEGNMFVVTLMPKFSKNIQQQLSQLPEATSDLNTILVVEDDYATAKLLTNYLLKWGYNPIVVNNEERVFEILDNEKVLAVILDIELPGVNGMELLRKIKAHPNMVSTPVIVCSVEVEEQKAFLMGAMEYFSKPINYNHLVEVLTSYKLRKNSTVLCVDDDIPTLNLVAQAVSTAGFQPLAEHVSAKVMDLIKDKDIDLAIIDLDMPHPNGFELIKMIKSEDRFKNLPIIIYTGKEDFAQDLEQIDGLFDELLSKKSTNIEDLADTIKSMINRYEEPKTIEEIHEEEDDDKVKILFAEDYKHSQIIVTRLLKKNGFDDIVVVENGEEALKAAQKEHFDIILMDMQMPIMNGFEAIEKLRQMPEYKDTPIISLTAFAMKGDREKCLDAGATDYIPKPIDSKEFIEKIKFYAQMKKK